MNSGALLPGQLQRQLAGQGWLVLQHLQLGGAVSDEVGRFLVEKFIAKALAWPQLAEVAERHGFDASDLCLIYTAMVERLMPEPVVWHGSEALLPTISFLKHGELDLALLTINAEASKADGTDRSRALVEAAGDYAEEIAGALGKRPLRVIGEGGMSMKLARRGGGCCLGKAMIVVALFLAAFVWLAVWSVRNARIDYSWAATITQERTMEGWTLAATQDNFSDIIRPWTWFKTPVTGLWFTKPNELRQNGDTVVASILRVSYDYSTTEQEEYLEFFDVRAGKSAFVPDDTPTGEVDHRTLQWCDYPPGTPGEKLIRFVQTAVRNR